MRGCVKEFKCVGGPLDGAVVKLRDGYNYLSIQEGIGKQFAEGDTEGTLDRSIVYILDNDILRAVEDFFYDEKASDSRYPDGSRRSA